MAGRARAITTTALLSAGLLLALSGCASGPPSAEETRAHMFGSWWRMGSIPSRLIVGDLDGARRPARWLRGQMTADQMLGDDATVARMEALTVRIEEAGTVGEAVAATAELAATCGACHEATDGGPRFSAGSPLPVGSRLSTHMVRHIWAADRMWEGLVAADSDPWDRGATVLTEPPLPFFEGLEDREEVGRLARRLHAVGEEALAVRDRSRRAELYAELIQTCAGCHEAMGVPGS